MKRENVPHAGKACRLAARRPVPGRAAIAAPLTLASTLLAIATISCNVGRPAVARAQPPSPTPSVARQDGGAPSPTGRTPRLFWTPQRQAVWNRMVADKDPQSDGYLWWHHIRDVAEGRKRAVLNQAGQMEALAYQMTGDTAYARRAWEKVQPYATSFRLPIPGDNGERIFFLAYDWVYDWIYPALSSQERQTFVAFLNWIGDHVLGHAPEERGPGTRTGNANGCIGHYLGLACMTLATAGDNPRAGEFLSQTWRDGPVSKPVGGLAATGADRSTMRNALAQYISMAQSGVWVEGTEYQDASLIPLFMGTEGVRTATGKDYFPEVTDFLRHYALYEIYQLTPDMRDSYQWGDDEHPRDLRILVRQTLAGEVAGLLQAQPEGPYAQDLVKEFEQSGADWRGGRAPEPSFYLFANPYAPAADWRTARLPKSVYGDGLLLYHNSWGPGDSFFGAQFNPHVLLDHGEQVRFQGDFQLYRHGEWAITHPIGYASISNSGQGTNSMLLAGLSTMAIRGPAAEETGSGYAYIAGSTYGPYYFPGRNGYSSPFWRPPPAFVDEWTRSILYLPAPDGHSDTVLVYDRTNCADPQQLEGLARYRPKDRQLIQAAPALKQWCIHCPLAPTVAGGQLSWTTPGGQEIRVWSLLPPDARDAVIQDAPLVLHNSLTAAEQKVQVRISPAAARAWDTFLNVVQARDSGSGSVELVRSASDHVDGAIVGLDAATSALAVFNAAPAAPRTVEFQDDPMVQHIDQLRPDPAMRLRSTGYSLSWKAQTGVTDVYLLDLNPSVGWSASADGRAVSSFQVTNQGAGRFRVTGAGPHTLTLTALRR